MWQSWMGWKMPSCKWHTFWIAHVQFTILLPYLFYIGRKWLLMRNLVTILPLKSKLSGKFQHFNVIDESIKCWKIAGFQKIKIKSNLTTSLEQKFSYGDMQKYADICFESTSRMQFWSVRKGCSANVFSDTKQQHNCWKICKVRKVFGCVAGAYYFQCQVSWGS